MPERDDALDRLAFAALVLVVGLALAPVLAVALPLGVAVDRGAWQRWPVAVVGVVVSVGLAGAGGVAAYHRVLDRLSSGVAPTGPDLLLALSLGFAVGVAVAPLAQAFVRAGGGHDHDRRDPRQPRRVGARADRALRRRRWPAPPGTTVLGVQLDGVGRARLGRWSRPVAVPTSTWQRQALIVGETGSGKTVTALTVASEAMRAGWDVYWIDGKADPEVGAQFLDVARRWGVSARDGLQDPIDGWRGGAESIVNRLLATQRFSEPYYAGIARNVLRWSVGREPPTSFAELLGRMDKRALRRRWADDPLEADAIRRLPARELDGARYRYQGVAWAVGTTLDGHWSYEDARAAYVPVGRPEHRDQAAEVGAFLLEDLLHWAMARKPRARDALVVIDEFSKLAARPDAAVDLVERVRSFRVGVVLIGQTWASLGATDTVRERLAGTVGTIVVHRLKAPERLVALAGTEAALERTEHLAGLARTGRVSQRVGRRFVVSPDDVRALGCGEAFLVTVDGAVRLRVRPPDLGAPGGSASR